MRGYACVALCNPKTGENVGGVMRACACFGAAMVVVAGTRYSRLKAHPTDTMKTWKHMPVLDVMDVMDGLPHDCVPVAVELAEGSQPLPAYQHPERAMYIFGPEDGSLSLSVMKKCRDVLRIDTRHCLNLAATVNVVLYDRLAKQQIDAWNSSFHPSTCTFP